MIHDMTTMKPSEWQTNPKIATITATEHAYLIIVTATKKYGAITISFASVLFNLARTQML